MTATNSDNQKEYVLFVVLLKANLLETLPIAHALKKEARYEPLYFVESKARDLLLPILLEEGFKAVDPAGNLITTYSAIEKSATHESPQKSSIKKKVFSYMPLLVRYWLLLSSKKKRMQAFLKEYQNIRAIITIGDRHIGFETALISLGRACGIPILIVPFAMSFPQASAEPRSRLPDFKKKYGVYSLHAKVIALLFPRWVYRHKGKKIFFRPPLEAFAAFCLGMMPKNPWIIGGGNAVKMAVESEAVRSMLISQGMNEDKMIVTGKPSLDAIASLLSSIDCNVVRKNLGIKNTERMILCSVPQLAEHDLLSWERHWEEMEFLFMTMAQQQNVKVVLSLHPKSDRKEYEPLAMRCGVTITTERIYDVLPACDIFVATYSSIVAQAIALKKPSIVVDFYDLDYPLYEDTPGVMIVKSHEVFKNIIGQLLEDGDVYAKVVSDLKIQESHWAILDGHNTARVVAELNNLIVSKDPAQLQSDFS